MLGVSLVAGGLTGLLGARSVGRAGLSTILRDGGRGSSGGRFGRLRDALIVSELALSLVLLVGAGLLAGHFQRLQTADLGFNAEGVITAQVALEQERFATPDARAQVVLALQDALGALPSVRAVGATSVNPLCCGDWGARVRIDGLDRPADAPPITIHHRYVTPEYFGALGVTVTAGRSFNAADAVGTALTVIIDEDLAARFWPGETAIGQRIGFEREGAELRTIVGVASRAHTEGDRRETWYLPMLQDPTGRSNEIVHLMIRGDVDATSIRTAVATVDAGLAVFGVSRMDDLRSERLAQDRLGAVVTGAFALAGLLLATIGLYGLLAYQIELQRRELGTRMALGARGADIRTMVLARTGRLLALGLTIGLVLSVWLSRLVVGFVDGVEPATPLLLLGLSGVLALAAAAATVVPVRRAVSADPASVLQDA
jgi:predicted permease